MLTEPLQHWGILGMKWGVRKNEDEDSKLARTKDISEASEEEIRKIIARLELEKRVRELRGEPSVATGQSFISSYISKLKTSGAEYAVTKTMEYVKAYIEKKIAGS